MIPTCRHPDNPDKFYIRILFCTFFYGPFDNEESIINAIKYLDKNKPHWDYDSFCIIKGLTPLPKDYVCGFPFIDEEMLKRIQKQRIIK